MKPRVLVTHRIPSSVAELLRAHVDADIADRRGAMPADELRARIADRDGLVAVLSDRVDAALLDAAPSLKVVANIAVGYDNIDLAATRARGVIVTNTPDVLTDATADFTMALMLCVMRRLAEGDRLVRRGQWTGWALDFMLGRDPRGLQLGIVGYGRIGRAVATRARAFGMRIARATKEGGPASGTIDADGAVALSLDELLTSSDVVSIHTPLTPGTRHMFNRRTLMRMKRSAYLVNTSRGPVVDEEALVWALDEHLIAGAGLDVFEQEPHVHPGLLGRDNVVLAPHLGSATTETRTAMIELAARNVIAVLSGQPPLTPV